MARSDLGDIEPGDRRVVHLRALVEAACKSHLMQYLAFGCAIRSIGKIPCSDITNSVKLVSTVVRGARTRDEWRKCGRFAEFACQLNFAKAEGEECRMS